MRLLLVARRTGEWLEELAHDPDLAHVLSASVRHKEPLGPLAGSSHSWQEHFEYALADLAACLPAATYDPAVDPASVDWARATELARRHGPAPTEATTVLDVQLAALSALLQAGYEAPVDPARAPEDVLLGYEERAWQRQADDAVALLPKQVRRWAVTVATTCTATETEAAATVALLPGLGDCDEITRLAVRGWLHRLYGTPCGGWSAVQPIGCRNISPEPSSRRRRSCSNRSYRISATASLRGPDRPGSRRGPP